jgi:hypothetical protein
MIVRESIIDGWVDYIGDKGQSIFAFMGRKFEVEILKDDYPTGEIFID